MDVPTETLKRSAWSRPINGRHYVSALTIHYWNYNVRTPFVAEKLLLPKRQFMEYMTPLLADMPETDMNVMLDAFNVILKDLKNETEH
ncbi:MAG: hypothetical protein IKR94_01725 [Bacteroidales bacterium]|nr:hypothetical protein [Bacteroidales bacterium]